MSWKRSVVDGIALLASILQAPLVGVDNSVSAKSIPCIHCDLPKTTDSVHLGPSIALPTAGLPQIVQVSASPDDADNLMACTFELDGEHGLRPEGAYVSLDGGNTWIRTMLNQNSLWVSETSCAMGWRGRAYLVTGVSDTSSGQEKHRYGTTEVYRSADGGFTWSPPRRYPFLDWMALGVEPRNSGNSDNIYLFANQMATGIGDMGEGGFDERRGPLLTSVDSGLQFASPRYPKGGPQRLLGGSFPITAISVGPERQVVLFAQYGASHRLEFTLYKADPTSYELQSTISLPSEITWYDATSAQMARAPGGLYKGRLYVAFPATSNQKAALGLSISDDEGKSWRTSIMAIDQTDIAGLVPSYAGIAVNRDGAVGISWLPQGGCPKFGISLDGGSSIQRWFELGNCKRTEKSMGTPEWIAQHVGVYYAGTEYLLNQNDTAASRGFNLFLSPMSTWTTQVAADANGRFHVFWVEARPTNTAALLTKTISLKGVAVPSLPPAGLVDVTAESLVQLLRQQFDPIEFTFSVDIAVKNTSFSFKPYPSLLQVIADGSVCGQATEYLNEYALLSGKPAFRVPRPLGKTTLAPNETTLPIHIEARGESCPAGTQMLEEAQRRNGYTYYPLWLRFAVYEAR